MGIPGAVGFFLFINIFLLQLSILFYINGSIAERERERKILILRTRKAQVFLGKVCRTNE